MKNSGILPLLCIVGLSLATGMAQAIDENVDSRAVNENAFLGQIRPSAEQTLGQGQSALWTLPHAATQYQPLQLTPAMQAALQAQQEGRFLDALILLDETGRQASVAIKNEMNLLRASFLLEGHQARQAVEILAPLLTHPQSAADAYALTAMAHLEQGQIAKALEAAQHAQQLRGGMLQHLILSYALQAAGRLAEARDVVHRFNSNTGTPQSAIALAREAELALTLDQVQSAKMLAARARGVEAHPYVTAVSGLAYLIDGQPKEAKAAFETTLQRDPKDAKALLGLGLSEIRLGNLEAGQKQLQAAHDADPGNALVLTYLGRAQLQTGQADAARASWRDAQDADPKDPTPWLYQAQAELQANRPLDARDSLREAQKRTAYRRVYRGEHLLNEDAQLLRSNLAEIQRQLGMETLAFQTLATPVGEKNANSLRNQADLLQGQRFGESARRSLLLQSLFNEHPGNLPSELDVYGDGAGQTGASSPQHGEVGGLNAQQASYNNYDELFNSHAALAADAVAGSKNTNGTQIRAGIGSDTLGVSVARREYKTDGNGLFNSLDNRIELGVVQWRPSPSTQAFVSQQTFRSNRGETFYPADTLWLGSYSMMDDSSRVTRFGLRHSLTDGSELHALWSRQQTDQANSYMFICNTLPGCPFYIPATFPEDVSYANSSAHSAELQYRASGVGYATQWGVQQTHGDAAFWYSSGATIANYTKRSQQFYGAWQQTLSPQWQLDAQLGRGRVSHQDHAWGKDTYLERWLPKVGVVYTPNAATHLRAAAWRGMGFNDLGEASLAPASVAGMLLNRPGDGGRLVKGVALGADRQLNAEWLLEGKAQRHWTGNPGIDGQSLTEKQIEEARLALHWQPPEQRWAVSLAYDHEQIRNDPGYTELDSIDKQHLRSQQLGLRWFASSQWTANVLLSHNKVTGTQHSLDEFFTTIWPSYQDRFNQLDASLNWQFNRRSLLDAGVRNAADTRFQYTNLDPLNPRFSNGRLVYAKLKFAW